MATEQLDARQLLAKMEAEEQAALEKAKTLAEENAKKRKELLEKLREDDLKDVKAKCELHGFTATGLAWFAEDKGGEEKHAPQKHRSQNHWMPTGITGPCTRSGTPTPHWRC